MYQKPDQKNKNDYDHSVIADKAVHPFHQPEYSECQRTYDAFRTAACSEVYRLYEAQTFVKLVLIDPKIVELKPFNGIPHLLTPVITDPKQAMHFLKYLIYEMERRYTLLDQMGARDIVEYRKKRERKKSIPQLFDPSTMYR